MKRTAGELALAAIITTTSPGFAVPSGAPSPPHRPPGLAGPDRPALPLPSPRPATPLSVPATAVFGPPMPPHPAPPSAPVVDVAAAAREAETCRRLLASGKVVAHLLPALPPTLDGCGIAAPIELSAIALSPLRRVALEPPVTINCALADAVADWVRQDLDPMFKPPGRALAALADTGGYACRGRNRIAGAKLSEHARGNALDIGAFRTTDGTRVTVTDGAADRLAIIKATACARFATVLGPGSDGFHERHMHVDLASRRSGSQICHWELPEASHDLNHPPVAAPSWNAGRPGPL